MSLSQKCMLVDLHLTRWNGWKTDKKISDKLTSDAGSVNGSARVNKLLVAKEAFTEIVTVCNAFRAHMTLHTLPWTDNGQRIMTRNIFTVFMEGYGALERQFKAAVDEFVSTKYPAERDHAAFRLGTLFSEADYPTQSELREKFSVNLDIDGITEPDDFRVALPEKELTALKVGMEESINRRLSGAMQDVWLRIASLLEHYLAKVSDSEAIFRDSTVNNLVDLMNILPGLNVTGDPRLKAIRQRIMATIGSYQPDDLRSRDDLRATAAREAGEIIETVRTHMKGD